MALRLVSFTFNTIFIFGAGYVIRLGCQIEKEGIMKELVINNSLNLVKRQYPDYDDEKIAVIRYGLEGIYLTVSKTIIIFLIAYFLGILKELIIFTLIYNAIRMPSFGAHAPSSAICLMASTTIFILSTYLCMVISISIWLKLLLGTIGIVIIFKNSPADTAKRPIINKKRRLCYKIISTVIAIIFVILSIAIQDNFISNSLMLGLMIQSMMTSRITYKLFGQTYDNYRNYQSE